MHAHMHRLQRKLGRSTTTLGLVRHCYRWKGQRVRGVLQRTQADHLPDQTEGKINTGKRNGQTIGTVADTKDRMVDTASGLKGTG